MALSNITGEGIKFQIAGKDYTLLPLTIADMGALEAYVRGERIKEFREQSKDIDPVIVAAGIESMVKSTAEQLDEKSVRATIFLLWRSVRKSDPSLTLETVGDMIDMANFKEIMSIVNALGGESKNPEGANG